MSVYDERKRCVRLTAADDEYGPICRRCYGPKDDQAQMCRSCRNEAQRLPAERRICECGEPKDPYSHRCLSCKTKAQARASKGEFAIT